ncbi:DNA-binding transcriptional regulator, LysR family [Roseovarius lutimaris]|uniref:DNA-binding transcriptional regulator, LysR family n=1 Tax=Roseovarius lutimaris TaxID=1005928 RepID=A0A1I5GSA1_9RHOB|nr:LysR family transcriptional regulator [Roseovarius lutimaris]SFO38760.1 DNA-binding transcriptional regulator, LysR family [Roseovarius lutimaris]
MKLLAYKYFVTIAGQLSFSRASEELNISQSALSRQIRLLEEDLGVQLFHRIGRRIELTQVGHILVAQCRTLLKDADQLVIRAKAISEGRDGILKIGATPQTLESVLASFLLDFRRKAPGIDIELIEDGSNRLEEHVADGDLDIAIGSLSPGSKLECTPLFPLGALAVAPDGSSIVGAKAIDVQELALERILLLRPTFKTRQIFDGICQVANMRPKVLVESYSPQCLLALVRARLGIAIVPSTVILGDLRNNAVPVSYDGRLLSFDMSVIRDPRRHMSSAAQQFVDELSQATQINFPGKSFGFQVAN